MTQMHDNYIMIHYDNNNNNNNNNINIKFQAEVTRMNLKGISLP